MDFYRSNWNRYLAVLAIFLFLPFVASFANPSNFTIKVVKEDGTAISGAKVYVWDKNSPVNSRIYAGPIMTDTAGNASLSLSSITMTATSVSNPAPNIGIYAVPPTANPDGLAWNVDSMLFYNFLQTQSVGIAPEKQITLKAGALIHLEPKLDGQPGVKVAAKVNAPVPWQFADYILHNITNSNLTAGLYNCYWPKDRPLVVNLLGDGNYSNVNASEFYNYINKNFFVNANEHTFTFEHNKIAKGQFSITLVDGSDNIISDKNATLSWNQSWYSSYGNNTSVVGNKTIYLPYGTYNFKVTSDVADEPIKIIPGVVINGTPQAENVAFGAGATVNATVQLGDTTDAGDESALAGRTLAAYLNVGTAANPYWVHYQDVGITSGVGPIPFNRKFAAGQYELRVGMPGQSGWKAKGVIDDVTNAAEYKSFAFAKKQITVADTTIDTTIIMPQTPAMQLTVQSSGDAYDNLLVAYMPENLGMTGYALTQNLGYTVNGTTVFVPFAMPGRDIVIRVDKNADNNATPPVPQINKVFAPNTVAQTGTTVVTEPKVFDSTNFVVINGYVQLNQANFQGYGQLRVEPIVPGTQIETVSAFGGDGTYVHTLAGAAEQYSFKAEKGQEVALKFTESQPASSNALPLKGFIPYRHVLPVAADATDNTFNVELELGGSFNAVLKDTDSSGNPIPLPSGTQVQIIVAPVLNDEWQGYALPRAGLTSETNSGAFTVSGLRTGEYKITFNIDGINPSNPDFTQQSMPLISRHIFVDEMNPPQADLIFVLDPASIGVLAATFNDDANNPVPGLKVQIAKAAKQPDQNMPGYYPIDDNYKQPGEPAFFCSTNAQGQLIDGNGETYIPLEAGEYEIYAQGVATQPTTFAYAADKWGGPVYVGSFRILPASEVTARTFIIKRKFKIAGKVEEKGKDENNADVVRPFPGRSFVALGPDGKSLSDYGEYWLDMSGNYSIEDGTSGMISFVFAMSGYDFPGWGKYYLRQFVVGQENITKNFTLDPVELQDVKVRAQTLDGQPVDGAEFRLIIVDKVQGLNGPVIQLSGHMTNPLADEFGNLLLQLPALPTDMASMTYALVPVPAWTSETIIDQGGATRTVPLTFAPPAMQTFSLPVTEELVFNYKRPAEVIINASNIPSGAKGRYYGALIPAKFIDQEWASWGTSQTGTGDDFQGSGAFYVPTIPDNPITAALVDGKFHFGNVKSGVEYVFVAFEAINQIDPDMFRYENGLNIQAMFRHMSQPFMVQNGLLELDEAFADLAPLSVEVMGPLTPTSTTAGMYVNPRSIKIGYTADPAQTTGLQAWPFIIPNVVDDPKTEYNEATGTVEIPFPIMVPVNRAFRVGINIAESGLPEAEKYLPKVDENVAVPPEGKIHNLFLKEMNKVYGAFEYQSSTSGTNMPTEGMIYVLPEGANFEDENLLLEVKTQFGYFEAYAPPGYYIGYAVPTDGVPTFISVLHEIATDTNADIVVTDGVRVTGSVTDGNGDPLYAAGVAVLRKIDANSDLLDGQQFIPYPVAQGEHVVKCAPDGSFAFEVEPDVNYYVQAIVPDEFRAPAPIKVEVAAANVTVPPIQVGAGAKIVGIVNTPAFIQAKELAANKLEQQFGSVGSIGADAVEPEGNGFKFKLVGLKPGVPYEITVWPEDPTKAIQKITNVFAEDYSPTNPLNVVVGEGHRVYGQLVDSAGNPLAVAGVEVNLAMSLPMEPAGFAASVRPGVMQNIRASVPEDFSLQNVILQGMWTKTNDKGEFEFTKVPAFLTAFIKTEKGFVLNGIDYGKARTDNFAPAFATINSMEVNVTVPVGGKIVGRLIDENGQPIKTAHINADLGNNWGDAKTNSDGTFEISGLAPGANYMVHVEEMPGFVPVFRAGVLVEPGKTTDLDTITVMKAVMVTGQVANLAPIATRSFRFGNEEGTGISVISFDGNHALTDQEIFRGEFMQHIVGEMELFWDVSATTIPTNLPFATFTRPGKAHFGIVLHKEDMTGVRTLVSWGWTPGTTVPTQTQLGTGSYNLTGQIACPSEFGIIEGTLSHSIASDSHFGPGDAVIAFYPLMASGTTEKVLKPVPFPVAITSPIDGKWFIDNIPHGEYRIKVITEKYGIQFFKDIVTIGATPVTKNLVLGTSVKRIHGIVKAGTTPIANAQVRLIVDNLATSTGSDGSFSFYLPVGAFILPQLEVGKPGFQTKRFFSFTGIATEGITLANDVDLGTLTVSGDVGRFEALVKSSDGDKPLIGAEVSLVYSEAVDGVDIWTVGEVQTTNESGVVKFSTVPTGREVKFRTRAFYHKPNITAVTVDATKKIATATITLDKALPKVFYTGTLAPVDGNDQKLRLKATFDFNQPVYKDRLGLYIGNIDAGNGANLVPGSINPVDEIGGRFTAMKFDNDVDKVATLTASVTYDLNNDNNAKRIGLFFLSQKTVFSKEFDVDPLAKTGFTGRQTDASGNQLPTGLTVPAGYLDPAIESFNINVEELTGDATADGQTTPAEFSGPAFEFTFNSGSSFGGSTEQKGLFEITIQYVEGQQLEPRWYDEANNRWSKVGIIDGSVKWDYPSAGYVTFKVSHLTKFAVLKNVQGAASGLRCDFNGDGNINTGDIAYMMAWKKEADNAKLLGTTVTIATVQTRAEKILDKTSLGADMTVLPGSVDDLNGDGVITTDDIAFFMAWKKEADNAKLLGTTITESAINTRAQNVISVTGSISKFPGEKVNR